MNPHHTQVALWAGHRCEYCHAPEAVFNLPLEVEHIVPVSRGGEDTAVNWALACRACNLYKAAHVSGRDPESDTVVRLFHPREDRWEDHFQVAPENGETDDLIMAHLADGRTISVPLAWSWRLSNATPVQRQHFEIIGTGQGVHCPDIDEDISALGMLTGVPPLRHQSKQ